MINIVEEHISRTVKKLKKYCSTILRSKYDKSICDDLLKTYINARYYNLDVDENIKVFYRRIYDSLRKKADSMISKTPDDKEKIENILYLFQFLFYFDFVRNNISIEEVIETISEKRISRFNLKAISGDEFDIDFTDIVKNDLEDVKFFLESFDTDEFLIDYSKINENIYRVLFSYNFDFPEIFNVDVIENTFNEGMIAEDKLLVEYSLISIKILEEILIGNFKRTYILDFAPSLFSKPQKLTQTLEIIDNIAVQEKMMLEISYFDFKKYRDHVLRLMRRGFRFALKTSSNMPKLTSDELQMLDVFGLVIVDPDDINKSLYK